MKRWQCAVSVERVGSGVESGCGVEWLCEGKENEENQSLFSLFDPIDDVIMTRGRVRSGGLAKVKITTTHTPHLVMVSLRRKRRQEESEMRIKGEIMCQRETKKEGERKEKRKRSCLRGKPRSNIDHTLKQLKIITISHHHHHTRHLMIRRRMMKTMKESNNRSSIHPSDPILKEGKERDNPSFHVFGSRVSFVVIRGERKMEGEREKQTKEIETLIRMVEQPHGPQPSFPFAPL